MRPPSVLGIDPGVRGGLAIVQHDGKPVHVVAFRHQWTERDLVAHVRQAVDILCRDHCREIFLERVGHVPGEGPQGLETFARVNGLIRGAIYSYGEDITLIPPQVWQAKMECLSGGNKNVTKRRAQEIFPDLDVTHYVADALLIAECGRRMRAQMV